MFKKKCKCPDGSCPMHYPPIVGTLLDKYKEGGAWEARLDAMRSRENLDENGKRIGYVKPFSKKTCNRSRNLFSGCNCEKRRKRLNRWGLGPVRLGDVIAFFTKWSGLQWIMKPDHPQKELEGDRRKRISEEKEKRGYWIVDV